MNNSPRPTTICLDKIQDEKLREISLKMKLNKDSLVNFWLFKEVNNKNPILITKKDNYVNNFILLENIKSKILFNSYDSNMHFHDFVFCYLKDPIDNTHKFLKSPLHIASFQKIIHHFEDTTQISKWPNEAFRNLRNIPEESKRKSDKKIYVLIKREPNYDGCGGEHIHSIYNSLELAMNQLKDLQRGKEINNYYGYHIDSYEENGGMDKCCIDIKK